MVDHTQSEVPKTSGVNAETHWLAYKIINLKEKQMFNAETKNEILLSDNIL